MASDRTGLLIIRTWFEEGSSEPLRAEVRISNDVSVGIERTLTLSRAEAVCVTVRDWLAGMLDGEETADLSASDDASAGLAWRDHGEIPSDQAVEGERFPPLQNG